MLEAINRGADRIDRIVRDLLDISRLYQGSVDLRKENVDLAALVNEVVALKILTAPRRHRIQLVAVDHARVRGDRDHLVQILNNLIDNAVKYSPKGGAVEVAVRRRGDEAVVSVSDQGIGIPKSKQARIFERFYRAHTATRHDYGGIGIGLYLSREFVERLGGRMWFESEEGRGSVFYFSLPVISG
jgi:signal transduction histidine kinase